MLSPGKIPIEEGAVTKKYSSVILCSFNLLFPSDLVDHYDLKAKPTFGSGEKVVVNEHSTSDRHIFQDGARVNCETFETEVT